MMPSPQNLKLRHISIKIIYVKKLQKSTCVIVGIGKNIHCCISLLISRLPVISSKSWANIFSLILNLIFVILFDFSNNKFLEEFRASVIPTMRYEQMNSKVKTIEAVHLSGSINAGDQQKWISNGWLSDPIHFHFKFLWTCCIFIGNAWHKYIQLKIFHKLSLVQSSIDPIVSGQYSYSISKSQYIQ